MIVIGADTHKSNHALAAVDAGTGQVVAERTIPAREPGHLAALRWARELAAERREALRSPKRHLARRIWRLLQPPETQDNRAMSIYRNLPRGSFALT